MNVDELLKKILKNLKIKVVSAYSLNKKKVLEAQHKWRKKNKEKWVKYTKEYYEKNKKKMKEKNEEYRIKNKKKINKRQMKYYRKKFPLKKIECKYCKKKFKQRNQRQVYCCEYCGAKYRYHAKKMFHTNCSEAVYKIKKSDIRALSKEKLKLFEKIIGIKWEHLYDLPTNEAANVDFIKNTKEEKRDYIIYSPYFEDTNLDIFLNWCQIKYKYNHWTSNGLSLIDDKEKLEVIKKFCEGFDIDIGEVAEKFGWSKEELVAEEL